MGTSPAPEQFEGFHSNLAPSLSIMGIAILTEFYACRLHAALLTAISTEPATCRCLVSVTGIICAFRILQAQFCGRGHEKGRIRTKSKGGISEEEKRGRK
jgi:hypothetical protein